MTSFGFLLQVTLYGFKLRAGEDHVLKEWYFPKKKLSPLKGHELSTKLHHVFGWHYVSNRWGGSGGRGHDSQIRVTETTSPQTTNGISHSENGGQGTIEKAKSRKTLGPAKQQTNGAGSGRVGDWPPLILGSFPRIVRALTKLVVPHPASADAITNVNSPNRTAALQLKRKSPPSTQNVDK